MPNHKQLTSRDLARHGAKPDQPLVIEQCLHSPCIDISTTRINIQTILQYYLLWHHISTDLKTTIPIKFSFCRRRYINSGGYEKDIRIANSKRNIKVASSCTNLINDSERDISNTSDLSERPDSDYQSEQSNHPGAYKGDEIPNMPMKNTNTKASEEHTSERPQQNHYTDTGEAIGDVQEYQEDHTFLFKNPWVPFTREQDFKLASWFIESKIPKSRINYYFTYRVGE